MPFDAQLRANGARAGVMFADGAASDFVGGAFPAIQQLHGPIEEQARLACHPHIVLHFVNRTSQAWLRRILLAETAAAKAVLRSWQEKTLLAVESVMSSCAGTARLLFQPVPCKRNRTVLNGKRKIALMVAWKKMSKTKKGSVFWFLLFRLLLTIMCADIFLASPLLLLRKQRRK